jgi:hypothetical protein
VQDDFLQNKMSFAGHRKAQDAGVMCLSCFLWVTIGKQKNLVRVWIVCVSFCDCDGAPGDFASFL